MNRAWNERRTTEWHWVKRTKCNLCGECLRMKSAKRSENIDSCAKNQDKYTHVWYSMLFLLIVFVPFSMRLKETLQTRIQFYVSNFDANNFALNMSAFKLCSHENKGLFREKKTTRTILYFNQHDSSTFYFANKLGIFNQNNKDEEEIVIRWAYHLWLFCFFSRKFFYRIFSLRNNNHTLKLIKNRIIRKINENTSSPDYFTSCTPICVLRTCFIFVKCVRLNLAWQWHTTITEEIK